MQITLNNMQIALYACSLHVIGPWCPLSFNTHLLHKYQFLLFNVQTLIKHTCFSFAKKCKSTYSQDKELKNKQMTADFFF